MAFRKVMLRIMLWSLAVAALVGAAAILLAASETVMRVVGTAITTAVAAGLLLALSMLADREKARNSGLLGMAVVIIQFLLAMILIWRIGLGSAQFDETVALTILFLFLTAPPAMLFLRFAVHPAGRVAGPAGCAAAGITFLLLALPGWVNFRGPSLNEWFESGWAVGAFGILAAAALAGHGTDRRYWRWLGVGASAAGLAIVLTAIWKHLDQGSGLFTVVCSIAVVVAHANLTMLCPLSPGQAWIRWATIAAAVSAAVPIDVAALKWIPPQEDLLLRVAGACGFVASCGSLALVVLARMNRRMGERPVLSEIRSLAVVCPGCQKKQTVSVGDNQCPTCNLRLHIRIEEPHCTKCDYLLFMLASDHCPECGTPVRQLS